MAALRCLNVQLLAQELQ